MLIFEFAWTRLSKIEPLESIAEIKLIRGVTAFLGTVFGLPIVYHFMLLKSVMDNQVSSKLTMVFLSRSILI